MDTLLIVDCASKRLIGRHLRARGGCSEVKMKWTHRTRLSSLNNLRLFPGSAGKSSCSVPEKEAAPWRSGGVGGLPLYPHGALFAFECARNLHNKTRYETVSFPGAKWLYRDYLAVDWRIGDARMPNDNRDHQLEKIQRMQFELNA